MRHIELHRERVILRRAVSGMRIALNVPVSAFLGIALHVDPSDAGERVAVSLEHRDPALSVPLFAATDSDDVVAEWRLWGRVLGMPLLMPGEDGSLQERCTRLGGVLLRKPSVRRRRRSAIKARRPRFLVRRKAGVARGTPAVHRGEREIIARN
jgi:hypothetical protein